MPFNIPTFNTSNISFGPGVLYLREWQANSGASTALVGNTPSVEVGAISEDGITVEMTSEKKYISQGNPRLNIFSFSQVQGASLSVTSIEWNFSNFKAGIGSGVVDTGSDPDTFGFGGDPACLEVALYVLHKMPDGKDLKIYIWKAVAETGVTIPLGQDEHSFEYKWNAMYRTHDWGAGPGALGNNEYLIRITRQD
tara:strand:- start:111 stop:698 length:588 start_codon:yes stop_codon:yes gene_type:complete